VGENNLNEKSDNLCRGLLRGDRDAIETIGTFLAPILGAEIANRDDIKDVQQHCLMELVEYLRRAEDVQNIWALARRISINSVIDFQRQTRVSAKLICPTKDGSNPETTDTTASYGTNALREVAARDQLQYILNAVSKKCRQIFKLLFVMDRSYTEASAEIGITEGNLRVRLSRCRDQAVELRKRVFGY
jgi:RNA polymerase sigma factor (sigma-70 family)